MVQRSADVLCIGMNDAAMHSRRLILEKAGHTVTQVRDLRQVQTACETNSFAVAVIGQWLNASEKRRVTDVVLTYCKHAKILELHTSAAPDLASADAHLQISDAAPQDLIDAVANLLRTPRKKKARQAI